MIFIKTKVENTLKIFQGFKGYNSLKKSELELNQANLKLKKTEQQTILDTVSAYFDLIFKSKSEEYEGDYDDEDYEEE